MPLRSCATTSTAGFERVERGVYALTPKGAAGASNCTTASRLTMLIAQLSDLHVRPEGVLYQGVADSNAQLAAAIAHVNGLDPRPDLVLLTGDLVDKGNDA